MKHIILSVFFLLFATTISTAQENIHGKITDEKGKPVSGAVIGLLNGKDSSLVKIAVSDKAGNYTIARNAAGPLLLKAEKRRFVTRVVSINGQDSVMDITLADIKEMGDVVITDRRKLIEEKSDRTVFNVEKSVVAFGGDALEAIKKMPGVLVQQQQINISGLSSVNVMVNGRLQHLSGDELIQFLRSIPANNLSKIELITSPGAKYDAAGNGGLINLVLKKNLKEGLNGSVTGHYNRNTFNSPSGSLSLQYRKGKFNFYTNDNAANEKLLYTNKVDYRYGSQNWNRTISTDYGSKSIRAQAGVDYELNKKMTIGIVYTENSGSNDGKEHVSATEYRAPVYADSIINSESSSHEQFLHKRAANINYEWRIDTTGKKLSVSADYFSQEMEKERNFNIDNYNGVNTQSNVTKLRIYESPAIDIRSVNADLELPYSFADISLGGKMSFTDNEAGFIFQRQLPAGFTTDSSKSNHFLYKEQIQAGYLSMKKSMKQFEVTAGLRAERTIAKGITPDRKTDFDKDYTQLFPSATISYKMNDHHNFVASYMRRIERPSYGLLNPFKMYFTENTYQQGTPGLLPAITNSFRISWYMNAKYHLRLRMNQVNNYFDRIYFTDSVAGATVATRANLGKAWFYVANFSFSESPAKWWDMNGEVSCTYNRFVLDAYGRANVYDGWSAWIELNNTFYLNKKKTLIAELNGYYYSPRQKDYKLWKEMKNITGGLKALLLNKALSVGVAFDDPFATTGWRQINKENGTDEYSYDDERSISVSVSYKFGNKNLKAKNRPEVTEEIQRAR